MKRKSNKNSFIGCAKAYIRSLQEEGRYSTAHVYKNAILSFTKFCDTPDVAFGQVNRDNLRRYGQYLYDCGLKPNTVSTYMRMLLLLPELLLLLQVFHSISSRVLSALFSA